MASSGFPGYDPRGGYLFGNGSTVQIPYQTRLDGGGRGGGGGGGGVGGGVLKRSMTEMERQMALQQAIFLRSVRQRTTSSVSPLSSMDFSSTTTASTTTSSSPLSSPLSSFSSGSGFARLVPEPDSANRSMAMRNQLQELERRLLDDDEEDDESAVTTTELGETLQQLISISPLSPSPSNSTSSTASSTASCSPSSSAPSRQLLSDAAAGIAEGNLEAAAAILAVLKRTGSNPRGDPEQRLTAVMITALASRLSSPPLGVNPISDLCSVEHRKATQMLHNLSPCFNLGLFAANLAILDTTTGGDQIKIHVIDFDVGGGSQHSALIHALAERFPSRPRALKITAVSDPTSPFYPVAAASLRSVGDWLVKLAERAGVGLRFTIVNQRIADLDPTSLGCDPGEALAVNLPFVLSKVADESVSPANPRDELLRRVRSLSPRVVTLVEQEMNANTAPFAARFTEACGHYGALLESLDATMRRDDSDRARLEAGLVRKATNCIAREGPDRVERCELFGKWRARFSMAGFKPVPLTSAISDPVRARFAAIQPNLGFTIKEEAGGIGFGWLGRVLTFASAWR